MNEFLEMSDQVESHHRRSYRVPENGKAELVNGEIVTMPPTGDLPNRAGIAVVVSLRLHEGKTAGRVYTDNVSGELATPRLAC